VNREIEYELCDVDNVFFLSNQTGSYVELDNYIIWGDTFWTSMDDTHEPNIDYLIRQMMNDFRLIHRMNDNSGKVVKFDPKCWRYFHTQAFKDLDRTLNKFPDKKFIVVTHHAPSEKSSSPFYIGQTTQPAYFTALEGFIVRNKHIKLWTHGHMHSSSDYVVGDTRIVVNPYGYAGYEMNPNFNPTLLLEV